MLDGKDSSSSKKGEVATEDKEVESSEGNDVMYIDEANARSAAKKKKDPEREEMSAAMKQRLREEAIGFGGSPNQAMGANYFLWIIVIISVLAVYFSFTGVI